MKNFKQYRRSQIAELRPFDPVADRDMSRVSISAPDKEAGSPKLGDMIARNPANHDDIWLVAADYFAANFEPLDPTPDNPLESFTDRLKAERDELDERLGKLALFLGHGAPGTTQRHRAMLNEQSRLMSDLLAVIDERLADLQIEARSADVEKIDG